MFNYNNRAYQMISLYSRLFWMFLQTSGQRKTEVDYTWSEAETRQCEHNRTALYTGSRDYCWWDLLKKREERRHVLRVEEEERYKKKAWPSKAVKRQVVMLHGAGLNTCTNNTTRTFWFERHDRLTWLTVKDDASLYANDSSHTCFQTWCCNLSGCIWCLNFP